MKKIISLSFCLVLLFGFSMGQINPKNLPNKSVITNQPGMPDIKSVLQQIPMGSHYIIEGGARFWAADIRNNKLVTDACYSPVAVFNWKFIPNSDGSFFITTDHDNTTRLAFEKSNLSIGATGVTTTSGNLSGFILTRGGSSGSTSSIHDKFWLRQLGFSAYRLYYNQQRDSLTLRLIPSTMVFNQRIAFNFDDLNGWQVSGNAFAGQPSAINQIPFYTTPVVPSMPLGGSYWHQIEETYFSYPTKTDAKFIHTARPGNNRWIAPDDSRTGVLMSQPFIACFDNFSFRIGGNEDAANLTFDLLMKVPQGQPGGITLPDGTYRVLTSYTGHNNDITRWVLARLPEIKHQICRFRITDQSTRGHLLVDAISFNYTGSLASEPRPADPVIPQPKPIWGAIDMHTHPMSYIGMGGKMMHGKLDGNPAVALGDCRGTHGGWGTDNPGGNYLRAEMINLIEGHYDFRFRRRLDSLPPAVPHNDHPSQGFPALVKWPVQHSMTHQQMWYEWLKRANEGGLKAIIALTVNNELLGRALGGDPPYDDKTTADRQIDELIAFVRRHDFIDTVTTPQRMRAVINSGRMAVIIGMEIDNIGNFYSNVRVTDDDIRNEITRLKNKGVRYIFPIHVTDNAFGGAALYKDLFIYASKYTTGQPYVGATPAKMWPPLLPGRLPVAERAPDKKVTYRVNTIGFKDRFMFRGLAEMLEAGGFPMIPPPPLTEPLIWTTANSTVKAAVDPVILSLKLSEQYQLAKKYFMDPHPEANQYDTVPREYGHRNRLGLTCLGAFAVKEMMRQGIMIDVDHASEKAVNSIIEIARANDYPVNSGHNGLRSNNDNEKSRTIEQLRAISSLGGMLGMGWEEQTPDVFNSMFSNHLAIMGNKQMTFGSDIGGYAATTKAPKTASKFINYSDAGRPDFLRKCTAPITTPRRDWDYNKEGMAHIGMVPDFFESLKKDGMGTDKLHQLFLSCEYFVRMWEKCNSRAPSISR